MFFHSLRFRLTLWYGLSLAVILTASGFFWQLSLATEMMSHVDDEILIVAEDVGIFHLEVHEEGTERVLSETDSCHALEDFIRKHNWAAYVQIVNEKGEISCFSDNMGSFRLPLDVESLRRAQQGKQHVKTIRNLDRGPVRMITYPLSIGGRITDIIQVGLSLSPMEEALHHLRLRLAVFSPLAFLILSLIGWLLSDRAIEPMIRITNAARKINAESIHQRLPVSGAGNEIDRLAETINTTLDRLAEAFNKVRQFTGDASHEMRTPLAILKGETEVALRWAKSPEELRSTLESNLEEINRMDRILEDLLALAKSEAGELRLAVSPFSLSDLLQDLYLQGSALAEQKEITVSLNPQVDREIVLNGDLLQLRRVFLNLLTNAIKYTQDGGRVELSFSVKGSDAVVTIADNGIGIDPRHIPFLFDRFYRADEARNRNEGGTGLGLAISKAIVDAHHGNISVESTPGEGSVFKVLLPLRGPNSDDMNV